MPAEGPGQAFPKPRRTGVCDLRLVALLLLACTLVGVLIFDIRLLRQQGRPIAHAQPNVAFLRESFVPSAFWGGEWVLVITNYDKDLGWLKDLPLHLPLRLAIFVKQDEKNARTCAMLPQEVSEHVALCREVPNAHGREAHTMSLFFSEYYDRLPRMILFLQDDCDQPADGTPSDVSCGILKLNMTREEFAAFTDHAEEEPFERDTCLCSVVVETNFRKCPPAPVPYELREGPGRCYGDRWAQVVLIFDLAVSDRIDPYATSLRWAMYAQFAVPGWAVRQLPLSFHKTALMLLDGLGEDQLEAHTATLGAVTRDPDKRWPSFEWAHAFERAWFGLLDAKYREKLDRDVLVTPAAPDAPPQPPSPPSPPPTPPTPPAPVEWGLWLQQQYRDGSGGET